MVAELIRSLRRGSFCVAGMFPYPEKPAATLKPRYAETPGSWIHGDNVMQSKCQAPGGAALARLIEAGRNMA